MLEATASITKLKAITASTALSKAFHPGLITPVGSTVKLEEAPLPETGTPAFTLAEALPTLTVTVVPEAVKPAVKPSSTRILVPLRLASEAAEASRPAAWSAFASSHAYMLRCWKAAKRGTLKAVKAMSVAAIITSTMALSNP